MQEENVFNAIIISRDGFSSSAEDLINQLYTNFHFQIEHFKESELTSYESFPNHEILTEDQKNAFLTRYHVKQNQLPRISMNEKEARHYGLRQGQVVKITRENENEPPFITYRLVV